MGDGEGRRECATARKEGYGAYDDRKSSNELMSVARLYKDIVAVWQS